LGIICLHILEACSSLPHDLNFKALQPLNQSKFLLAFNSSVLTQQPALNTVSLDINNMPGSSKLVLPESAPSDLNFSRLTIREPISSDATLKKSTSAPTAHDSPLLRLPAELKTKIYALVLTGDENAEEFHVGFPEVLSRSGQLLRVCKKVHDDAAPCLYASTAFQINIALDSKSTQSTSAALSTFRS
jgi:hypothetical protein